MQKNLKFTEVIFCYHISVRCKRDWSENVMLFIHFGFKHKRHIQSRSLFISLALTLIPSLFIPCLLKNEISVSHLFIFIQLIPTFICPFLLFFSSFKTIVSSFISKCTCAQRMTFIVLIPSQTINILSFGSSI